MKTLRQQKSGYFQQPWQADLLLQAFNLPFSHSSYISTKQNQILTICFIITSGFSEFLHERQTFLSPSKQMQEMEIQQKSLQSNCCMCTSRGLPRHHMLQAAAGALLTGHLCDLSAVKLVTCSSTMNSVLLFISKITIF